MRQSFGCDGEKSSVHRCGPSFIRERSKSRSVHSDIVRTGNVLITLLFAADHRESRDQTHAAIAYSSYQRTTETRGVSNDISRKRGVRIELNMIGSDLRKDSTDFATLMRSGEL